ncbi:hypothetical protein [Variovorax sp. V15]|uniref:hypothetical protein n=1 Tax=Variovorax sp. V15 TaxID=3065952 RepID=UPI0034E88E33
MTATHTSAFGVEISLRIGQHVRHWDHRGQRVTGVVHGLCLDHDSVLQADIVLDAPIVIPAVNAEDHELRIWRQYSPAHELAPFDDRDELIDAAQRLEQRGFFAPSTCADDETAADMALMRAALAKVTGRAA